MRLNREDPAVTRARKNAEHYQRIENWHPFFAWRRVWVGPKDCRWLEFVERKLDDNYNIHT